MLVDRAVRTIVETSETFPCGGCVSNFTCVSEECWMSIGVSERGLEVLGSQTPKPALQCLGLC